MSHGVGENLMRIRQATVADNAALYDVCLRTGDAGDDATDQFHDRTLLGSIFVGPYLALEHTLAYTAVDDQGPGGYALAALDTRTFEAACEQRWWPTLRAQNPDPGPIWSTPDEELQRYIHHPPVRPDDLLAHYPAHLHIDLLPRLQGRGIGRQLIETLLTALRNAGPTGVHLGVDENNRRAIRFYERIGFAAIGTNNDERIMGLRLHARQQRP